MWGRTLGQAENLREKRKIGSKLRKEWRSTWTIEISVRILALTPWYKSIERRLIFYHFGVSGIEEIKEPL